MEFVTDIAAIEYMAVSKEDENWRFMVFLKGPYISGKDLNGLVRELCRSISAHVDCTSCANCCRNLKPVLEPADIRRLSEESGLSEDLFFQEYLITDPEGEVIFKSMPCDFLKNRKCSCYVARPEVCRSYPHLLNSDFRSRLIKIVQNCSICPIVYNVYEGLKKKFEEPFRAFEADLHFLN